MNFERKLLITFIGFICLSTTVFTLLVTPLGCIKGRTDFHNGIAVRAFLGIPYVKPPIGDFRFKKPVPFGSWNVTLQATALPPGCPQYSPNPFPWGDYKPGTSINCLYLNIWIPVTADTSKKKSVMIWLHGGGFRIGSTRNDFYNGQVLAAEGDVVVVTFNYRLGVEGFFYSGTEDSPGNMGIWDMVEGLKWVRDNIQSFGGDKNSVTVFGLSAGSIAIGMLCTSPITKDLFKRIIMQSGSPLNMAGEDNDRSFKISQKLALAVNCASDKSTLSQHPKRVVECLKGKDGFELAVALSNVTADSSRSYYPRYGDDLFPTNPRLAIINGDFTPVDLLIGSNNGDGASLITKSMTNTFGFFGEKYPQINYTFGASIIKDKFKNFSDPEAVVVQYLGKAQEGDYNNIRFQVFTASGDYSRTCPSNYFAESFAEKGVSAYYYFFTHRPSYTVWAPWMLAVHHDETPFVFGYPLRYPHFYTSDELMLSRRLIKAWSSFAKTGIPEFRGWPLYSKKKPVYQVLDVINFRGIGPHRRNCNFFRRYFGIR